MNLDPENAEAYLGKLMAELHVKTRDALKDQPEPFNVRSNYKKAYRFGDEKLKAKLSGDIAFINERNENARLTGIYNNGVKAMNAASTESAYKSAASTFQTIPGFKDADALADRCLEQAEICRKNEIYESARSQMTGSVISDYKSAIKAFRTISGWKDADDQILACERKIEEIKAKIEKIMAKEEADRLERERKAEEARIAEEKAAKKRKRTIAIVTPIIVACIAFVIVLTTVIIPNQKYAAAVELYTAGKYEDAIAAFSALDGYKDSAAQIEKCETAIKDEKYAAAVELYTAGKYEEAITAFSALNGHKDSAAQIEKCETAIKDGKYAAAVELYKTGKYEDAITAFTALDGYKDSTAKIKEIKPKYYKQLFSNASVGSTVFFGSYEQDNNTANGKEDIEWIVLAKEGTKLLLISKYALDCQKYNPDFTDVTWETCPLREWLNSTFLNAAFSSSEKYRIISSTVTADKNPRYSTPPGKNTTDKVFLLSITEVNKYFSTDNARQCQGTEYCYAQGADKDSNGNCWWWLRSPGCDSRYATGVNYDGSVSFDGDYAYYGFKIGVRPALWIDLGS